MHAAEGYCVGLKSWRRRETITEGEDGPTVIGEEHAWWAERDELERVFVASPPESDGADDDPLREFWSPESLFTYDQRMADEAEDDTIVDPYGVLGLPVYATWGEVTAAHRRLAKQYHPDVMIHAADDERAAAEEQMREINRAYNQIRRARETSVS